MASDYDHGQISQEYNVWQVIQFDSKLRLEAHYDFAKSSIPKVIVITRMIESDGSDGGRPAEIKERLPNLVYE